MKRSENYQSYFNILSSYFSGIEIMIFLKERQHIYVFNYLLKFHLLKMGFDINVTTHTGVTNKAWDVKQIVCSLIREVGHLQS